MMMKQYSNALSGKNCYTLSDSPFTGIIKISEDRLQGLIKNTKDLKIAELKFTKPKINIKEFTQLFFDEIKNNPAILKPPRNTRFRPDEKTIIIQVARYNVAVLKLG